MEDVYPRSPGSEVREPEEEKSPAPYSARPYDEIMQSPFPHILPYN